MKILTIILISIIMSPLTMADNTFRFKIPQPSEIKQYSEDGGSTEGPGFGGGSSTETEPDMSSVEYINGWAKAFDFNEGGKIITDEQWDYLRNNMEEGIFLDYDTKESSNLFITKNEALNANCKTIMEANELALTDHNTIIHHESYGCDIVGSDYAPVILYHYNYNVPVVTDRIGYFQNIDSSNTAFYTIFIK